MAPDEREPGAAPDEPELFSEQTEPTEAPSGTEEAGDEVTDAPQVEGADAAPGADDDEPVVVTTEVQPDTDEVVDVQPEGEPEPPMLHGVLMGESRGQVVLHPTREEYPELIRRLRGEGYWACLDVTAVDYLGAGAARTLPPGISPERYEVVAMVMNHAERSRVRVRVQVPAADATIASIVSVHPGAESPEREVFDMFGIHFDGHPDLTRILMPEEWEGHPLRKDEHSGRIPVQFKDTASGQ